MTIELVTTRWMDIDALIILQGTILLLTTILHLDIIKSKG